MKKAINEVVNVTRWAEDGGYYRGQKNSLKYLVTCVVFTFRAEIKITKANYNPLFQIFLLV